jgi:hypothetical protein
MVFPRSFRRDLSLPSWRRRYTNAGWKQCATPKTTPQYYCTIQDDFDSSCPYTYIFHIYIVMQSVIRVLVGGSWKIAWPFRSPRHSWQKNWASRTCAVSIDSPLSRPGSRRCDNREYVVYLLLNSCAQRIPTHNWSRNNILPSTEDIYWNELPLQLENLRELISNIKAEKGFFTLKKYPLHY